MGLDGVELVVAVEDTFAITIDDEEAFNTYTVGELHDLEKRKLLPAKSKGCLTSHVFYRLRSTLCRQFGVQRGAVTPGTRTERIVPLDGRRSAWDRFSGTLGWKVPPLFRSGRLEFFLGCLVVAGLFFVIGVFFAADLGAALVATLVSVVVVWAGWFLTAGRVVHFSARCTTVGGLCQDVLTLNFDRITGATRGWNDREVWQMLQRIIADQLAVDPRKVVPEARFIEDLGMD